jgi:hypothetical protein
MRSSRRNHGPLCQWSCSPIHAGRSGSA